jgi:dihydrofolate reductase
VVTHEPPPAETVPKGASTITFVTEGVERAVERARAVAGDGVVGLSGASIAQQALAAGLVDEIRLHVAPVLLGDGVRLFAHLREAPIVLDDPEVIQGSRATHLRYRVQGR